MSEKIKLSIKQPTGVTEQVTSEVIDKLYQVTYEDATLGIESQVDVEDSSLDMTGSINAPAAFEDAVTYLRNKFPNLTITVTDNNYYIRFADSNVEQILKNAGIGDSVGISKSAAAAVQYDTIKDLFVVNAEITSFDELKYFTSVTSLPQFQFCSKLKSIDMSNITTINRDSCRNSGIKIIDAPRLTHISRSTFLNCTSLEEVRNLGTAEFETGFDGGQFNGCTSLRIVHLPDTLATLPAAFSDCRNIEAINFPETLTTIIGPCFYGALVAGFVVYLPNVISVTCPFTYNSGARYVYMPSLPNTMTGFYATAQGQQGFMCGNSWGRSQTFNVLYFRDITRFGAWSFARGTILNLVINNSTPPTIVSNEGIRSDNNNAFTIPSGYENQNTDIFAGVTSIVNIYVPDSAVATYQASPGFESVSSKIKALSLMAKVATRAAFDELSDADKTNTLIEEYM